MQFLKSTFGGILITFLAIVAILIVREPKLFTAPNSWVINDSFDGFRSYAAMYYHVKHDSAYLHYQGMNYPYGDHNAFTDNLPLVTNTVKFISQNITDISDQTGAALNIMMLLSIILCAIFLFLSFKELKLPNWYAIPVAIGITLLSPQLLRMPAHYGLAHPFVVPLIFYLSALFHKKKRWWLSLCIALALFLATQLHFYFFAIGGGFILALFFFKTLFAFDAKALLINCFHLSIQIILPLILLQLMLADDILDRPTRPYGFFAYRAYWESVFLPVDFKLGSWISEYITPIRPFNREGIAYIGLVPVLFLIKEIFQKIRFLMVGKEYHTFKPEEHRFFLKSAFWACLMILLFSFGLPFLISGLEAFRFKLGPIGQFRSIGRFAWVFFYVFNIIAWYAIYFQVKKIRKQGWQAILFAILLGILLAEGSVFIFQKLELKLYPHPELRADFKKEDNTWLEKINVKEYQAIFSIPYFHTGSENFSMAARSKELHHSMWLAVQTGLPINSSFMGRTSPGQIGNQFEILAEPYRRPAILNDYPNQKDFLLFLYKKSYKINSGRYRYLLEGLSPIHEDDKIGIYRLPYKSLEERILKMKNKYFNEYKDLQLFKYDTTQCTDSIQSFVINSFDDQVSEKVYRGKGAFERKGKDKNVVFDGHLPFQQNEMHYVVSLWTYMQGDLHPKTRMIIEEYQAGTNMILQKKRVELYKGFQVFEAGWILNEFNFTPRRPDSRLRISVQNKELEEQSIFFDELQIRKGGTKTYRKVGEEEVFNNRWH